MLITVWAREHLVFHLDEAQDKDLGNTKATRDLGGRKLCFGKIYLIAIQGKTKEERDKEKLGIKLQKQRRKQTFKI